MNLFQELRQRRIFQIASAYVVGGWGVLQFLAFLESRMTISPHLVNLVGLSLLLLLPAVVILAWTHGRPGKDTWGRTPKVVVAANVLAVILLMVYLFNGRDLGGMTRTVTVEDEHGTVSERTVPKNEFRRRVLIFYLEPAVADGEAWPGEAAAILLAQDLSQDGFLDVVLPLSMVGAVQQAGSDDGHGLARPLQRKLARDANIACFLTGTIEQTNDGRWQIATQLHESESGKVLAARTDTAPDLFTLVDQASRQLREDLGLPAAHLDESPDLPVAEITSADLEAIASHTRGMLAITHQNDWAGAVAPMEDAVARDPHFTLAQFLLFAVRETLGDAEGSSTAIAAAMENLYRVPERLGFLIKSQYYFSEKQDSDKAMAVLRMWTQIYPNDVTAYQQLATYSFVRQDLPGAVAAYEQILAIDPSQVQYLEELADLHAQLGDLDAAERCLRRYVDTFPTRADGYENLSDFYSATGRLVEAREALEHALLLDPEDTNIALSLVDLDLKFGRYEQADAAIAELAARAKTPRDRLRIDVRLLDVARRRGRSADVIAQVDAIHETMLEIQNPLQANLAYTMVLPAVSMAGQPQEALDRLAAARSTIPAPYDDLAGVGQAWVYAGLGRVAEARTAIAAAVEVVETYKFETFRSSIAVIEGMIAEADGDLDAAVTSYRAAIEMAIQAQPEYRVWLARALRLTGKNDEAMAVLDEAVKVEPAFPQFQLELAHLAFARGDREKAQEHLRVALAAWNEADPEYAPAQEARELGARIATP